MYNTVILSKLKCILVVILMDSVKSDKIKIKFSNEEYTQSQELLTVGNGANNCGTRGFFFFFLKAILLRRHRSK
jgi:hypothetical protein